VIRSGHGKINPMIFDVEGNLVNMVEEIPGAEYVHLVNDVGATV